MICNSGMSSFINEVVYSYIILESGQFSEPFSRKLVTTLIVESGVGATAALFIYTFFLITGKSLRIVLIQYHNPLYSAFIMNIQVNSAYNDILNAYGLNTLTFNDPYAKLCFTAMLASQYRKIIYIDLDTTFTAYLKTGLLLKNIGNIRKDIKIYLPTEGTFEFLLRDVIDAMSDPSVVIFDSVNSFYNMYYKKIDTESGRGLSNLNHLLSIFLMILLKHGKSLNVPILVTSMIRYKKDNEWVQSNASKRLLQKKSIVKLNIALINGKDLSVEIIRHPILASRTIIFRSQGVNL